MQNFIKMHNRGRAACRFDRIIGQCTKRYGQKEPGAKRQKSHMRANELRLGMRVKDDGPPSELGSYVDDFVNM